MLVSLALLVVGARCSTGRTAHIWTWLLLLGFGGWAITIVRCIQFAWHSDLRGLPAIDRPLAGAEPARSTAR